MKKLCLLLFILMPGLLLADNVSQQRAQSIAEQFLASQGLLQTRVSSLRMVWNGENLSTRSASAPAFYVFNNEGGRGFVIVSGDDRTLNPILAYSTDQPFDAQQMPENLRTWMMGIRSDINRGRELNLPVTPEAKANWNLKGIHDHTPIVLLETALWDQRDPYNAKLPLGWVTGCPATAISIIMRYHEWPDKGVGLIPQYRPELPAIQLGHTYDWANMPLNYTGATDVQREEVAVLMRDVGAMIRTEYRGGSAGAKPEETLPQLMPVYMRYNQSTIKSILKKHYGDSEWHKIMQKELDEKRPILYGGYSSGGGHQFVLDGYAANNYYHVNWGWSGVSNGYYLLTDMNPPEQGAGGSMSADGFTQKQDAIIGIQPDPENPGGGFYDLIAYKPIGDAKPFGLMTKETSFVTGTPFDITIREFQNKGSRAFAGKLAIGHYSADGELKEIVSREISYHLYKLEVNDFTEVNFKGCVINQLILPGDRLCGVFKHLNPSDWTIIRNGYTDRKDVVEEILLKEGGEVTPQPTNDLDEHVGLRYNRQKHLLTIITEAEDAVTLQLLDAQGRDHAATVSTAVSEGFEIDAQALVNGEYTLKLSSEKRGQMELKLVF